MEEDPDYLSKQLITYIGNKRSLLDFIAQGVTRVQGVLGKSRLRCFDVFSGSGVVSRFLKAHSEVLYSNDLEPYSSVIGQCYLTNKSDFDQGAFDYHYQRIMEGLGEDRLLPGLISELYAPKNEVTIEKGERVFYTPRNSRYLDTARKLIFQVPERLQPFFLGPLLSLASVHANTAGVFKGFYKNTETGIGHFGGRKQDALVRIKGPMTLPRPIFSRFDCETHVLCADANTQAALVPPVDLAYLDPPYNQHPYGSNYFMLNLLVKYQRPESLSQVSGIPKDWNRSAYNKAPQAQRVFTDLVGALKASYVLVSFNSEGFISRQAMEDLLAQFGSVEVIERKYNTFRGSRNLKDRPTHVKEYLFLLKKKPPGGRG